MIIWLCQFCKNRFPLPTLHMSKETVQKLAYNILSFKEMGKLEDVISELRKRLVTELGKQLPPPIVLPERRSEHLVETCVTAQIDSCIYHNSRDAVSLYEDHCCGRDQIPKETAQILTAHSNGVLFMQFSNNGEYIVSSSSDCTAIIWKVMDNDKLTMKHTLRSHQNPVSFVAWSPDDTKLLTCGK